MAIAEYGALDGLGLAALVRRREVTPAELLEEAIRRAERVNPRLNAICTPLYDWGRAAAAAPAAEPPGAFAGVPFLLKDLEAALGGVRLGCGSRYLAAYTPAADGNLVARLRRAGLVIFGKTNTPELGLTPFTEPEANGPTRNPWDLTRTPGGSSGGSAAAVAAGVVPMAHANDGGGSIRIPASCCGLFGLKPTRARTPVGPERGELWGGWAIEHAVTRTVRDSAALLDATAGPEPTAPYHAPPPARPFLDEVGAPPGRLRIAFTTRPPLSLGAVHPDCAAAVEDAASLCRSLGHEVEEAAPDLGRDPDLLARDFFRALCVEMATIVARSARVVGRRPRRRDLETSTWLTVMIGRRQSAVGIALGRERLGDAARRVARFFERYDLLLTPTLARPPVEIGALKPKGVEAAAQELVVSARLGFLLRIPALVTPAVRRVLDFVPFTPIANLTGQPSMTVPLWWNDAGLPVGTLFTARFGDEATLFRLAAQLESARPWAARRPPVHADAS